MMLFEKKIIQTIIIALFMVLSLYSNDINQKDDEVYKTKESQFGEIIEVIGNIPMLKAVQSVTVFNQKDIESINSKKLKDLLVLTPGLLNLSTGQFGQTASTFIRGSKSTQILYIIDGIKIRDYTNIGGINLSILPSSMIDNLEIVRGPLSNIYGSDAQGGVVNISTLNDKNKYSFNGYYGSYNSYMSDISVNRSINNLDLSLSVSTEKSTNNIPNDIFKNTGISTKLLYSDDKFNIGFNFLGTYTNSGVPLTWDLKPSLKSNYKQDYSIFSIPLRLKFSDTTSLKLTGSYISSKYNFSNPGAFFNFHSKLLSNSYNIDGNINTSMGELIDIKLGFEFSSFSATNETDSKFLIDNERGNYFAAYLHGDIDMNNLFLFFSLRMDKYKNITANISPQIGFSYLIDNMFKIHGTFSNSFKAPLITQQINPWGISNFNLKPEKSDTFEIGFDYYSKIITFGITYFKSSYKDMIDWVTVDMTTWAGQYQNITAVNIKGLEFIAGLKLNSNISFKATYTYLDTENVKTGKPLLRRPKHSVSGLFIFKNESLTSSLQFVYVGKRSDTNPILYSTLTESPSFNTFNFNITVPLMENLSVSGRLTNVLNTEYSEIYGYQSPKRRFELGIRYSMR